MLTVEKSPSARKNFFNSSSTLLRLLFLLYLLGISSIRFSLICTLQVDLMHLKLTLASLLIIQKIQDD